MSQTTNPRLPTNDSPFYRSHLRQPRGHGLWAFGLDTETPDPEDILWADGTFSEAAREASIQARALGAGDDSTLFVLP